MASYFASFTPVKEGGYVVQFKDFDSVVSQGDDIVECVEMAEDLLAVLAEEYTVDRKEMPKPSSLEEVRAWTLEDMQADASLIDCEREPFYQCLRMPSVDTKPVKVMVSFPKNILEQIDKKADNLGLTRSRFLANSALAYEG